MEKKVSRRLTKDGVLDRSWSSQQVLAAKADRLRKGRQAAAAAANSGDSFKEAVTRDGGSQAGPSRTPSQASNYSDARGRNEQEPADDGPPVKPMSKPARLCTLLSVIPGPQQWLAAMNLPFFPPPPPRRDADDPEFRELDPPIPGWVEVVREVSPTTHLDLSSYADGQEDVTDAVLLAQAALSCGTLSLLDVTGCFNVSTATVVNVARANSHLVTIRATEGAGWSASAIHTLLRSLPELRSIHVDLACRKVDEGLLALLDHNIAFVRKLTITGKLEKADVVKLSPPMMKAALLQLDLTDCGLGPGGIFPLAAALERNKRLTHLVLTKNNLGIDGGRRVAELLRVNRHLTYIHLGKNSIQTPACIDVCRALCKNRGGNDVLRDLFLSRNAINGEAARHIVEMLNDNQHLRTLDLADNDLGPQGKYVCLALEKATPTQVFLAGNRMGDRGARALLKTLRKNSSIWKITYYNNGISPKLDKELAIETLESLLEGGGSDGEDEAAPPPAAGAGGPSLAEQEAQLLAEMGSDIDDDDEDDDEDDEEEEEAAAPPPASRTGSRAGSRR